MDTSTISYNLKSIGQIVNSIEDIKDMPILGVKSDQTSVPTNNGHLCVILIMMFHCK